MGMVTERSDERSADASPPKMTEVNTSMREEQRRMRAEFILILRLSAILWLGRDDR